MNTTGLTNTFLAENEKLTEANRLLQKENNRLQNAVDGFLETGSSKLSIKQYDNLQGQNEKLKEQVEELREALSFAYTCCYHPNFTDRHGMMDKMKAALNNTAV